MIKNDAEFRQTLEQLERMYRALADLRETIMPKNARTFHVMAEGPLDQIRQLQEEIENFVAATQVEEHEGDLREIDLDDFSFILRNVGDIPQIQCTFDTEMLDTAKKALDRRVRVTGERHIPTGGRPSGKLRVTRLDVI